MNRRLALLSFMQFAVWGAYLTSMGGYLACAGLGTSIGWFYSAQGFVSLVMPTLMGIVADRWIQAQRLLSMCHAISSTAMGIMGYIALHQASGLRFDDIFPWYVLSVAFYMPTLPLNYSVSYSALEHAGIDAVKHFPRIRIWGTVGFLASVWTVDLCGLQHSAWQFVLSAFLGLLMAGYSLTLPQCPVGRRKPRSLFEGLGLNAFSLFKQPRMAVFFVFAMLVGVNLHITNGYANPFISSYAADAAYADAFVVNHPNLVISLSQCSEALCFLLIPFFMRRFGVKAVVLTSMGAWALRFGFFAIAGPEGLGVVWLVLSMLVYGVAFDFFNISGSLFVNSQTESHIRSSAQGLFIFMTNGIGAGLGMLGAQMVVNTFTWSQGQYTVGDWPAVWSIFAAYAGTLFVLFALLFRHSDKT